MVKLVVFIILSLSSIVSFYFTYEKYFLAKLYSAAPGMLQLVLF